MLDHRLPANIDDESYLWSYLRYVGEVLLRPDADVGSARCAQLAKPGNDGQVRCLVGYEIVGPEVSAVLREFVDDAGELGRGYACRAIGLASRFGSGRDGCGWKGGRDYRQQQCAQQQD